MSFSAGGANTSGVMSVEGGVLKVDVVASTFSNAVGENNDCAHTVPAGKKWIIKGISTATGTFVGTLTTTSYSIIIGGTSYVVQNTSGASTVVIYNLSQPLTMSAGQTVRVRLTTSAWTSGQMNTSVLLQEVDA